MREKQSNDGIIIRRSKLTNPSSLCVSLSLCVCVCVCSNGKLFKAKKLVLAAGAWTNDLLTHLDQQLDLEIWAMHWGHYRVDPKLRQEYPQWFCFRKEDERRWDGGLYYGFPAEGKDDMIKVGIDFCPEDPEFRMRRMADYTYVLHYVPKSTLSSSQALILSKK